MKRVYLCFFAILLLIFLLNPLQYATSQEASGKLYEEGIFEKEVEGDLEEAIKLFLRVIAEYPEDREVGARAQLQIGICYEKMRLKDASEAYQKVIENYPTQEQEVAYARARLVALTQPASDAQSNSPTYRLVLDSKITGMSMDSADFSPSGDRVVFTHERRLYMADGTGTVIRPLFDDSASGKIFGRPRWSPDGQQIAYLGRHDDAWAIFFLSPDGETFQRIFSTKQRRAGRLRWAYDSKHLTYLDWDGFHVITLDGSEVRFIPGEYLPGEYNIRSSDAEYSPNGRWLAYCGEGENEERGLWILAGNPMEELEPRKGGEEKKIEQEEKVGIAGIPDPNLEAAIREAIGKPDGAITKADLENITELEAPDNNISDITGIEKCVNLERLVLGATEETNWESSNQIEDISPLEGLTKLVHLNLNDNEKISDIGPLSNLTNLTWLDLSGDQRSDITPLANLTNLTWLNLYGHQRSDITPLSNLTNLTWLNLTLNQISDITPLANLTNLKNLYLGSNHQISDVTPLSNLTGLEVLYLDSNQVNDVTPLSKLTNLIELYLWGNQITDIVPLANLTNLTRLILRENQIGDVTPLANLTNLTYLDLDHNQISDITPLANLTNLTRLQVGGNRISDITPLAKLTNLTFLVLSINQISDITTLSSFADLNVLHITRNQISDASPLANLTKLTELQISGNQLSDITPLSNLTNLTKLHLESNQISDVTPLVNLTNLTELRLRNNQISDMTPLSDITNLVEIGIPATDPTWAPDGHTLYFVNNGNIWRLPIDPETGLQKGDPQQVTFFEDAKIRSPKVLRDGAQIAFQLQRTETSINVANGSPPYEPRILVRGGQHIPQVSPDGQTIYYISDLPGEEGIYAIQREDGTPERLTKTLAPPCHEYLPCFHLSTDGSTLAYMAKLDEGRGLFTLSVIGDSEPQLLVDIGSGYANPVPQWSPDGSQLAYADGNGLYVIPATGGQPHQIAHLPDNTRGWDAWTVRWSPDGEFIAAIGYTQRYNAVFVVSISSGELRQLTPDSPDSYYLEGVEWHPDGQRLSYNVDRQKSEAREAYMDGRPPTTLVDHPDSWDYIGVWAPDGRRFFYMSWPNAGGKYGYGVYIYDSATGDITVFADIAAVQSVPRWSRDGKTAAWYTTRETEPQVWVMENFLPESTASR